MVHTPNKNRLSDALLHHSYSEQLQLLSLACCVPAFPYSQLPLFNCKQLRLVNEIFDVQIASDSYIKYPIYIYPLLKYIPMYICIYLFSLTFSFS